MNLQEKQRKGSFWKNLVRLARPLRLSVVFLLLGILLAVFLVSLIFAYNAKKEFGEESLYFVGDVFQEEQARVFMEFHDRLQSSFMKEPAQWDSGEVSAAMIFEKLDDQGKEVFFKRAELTKRLLERNTLLGEYRNKQREKLATLEKKLSLPMFTSSSSQSMLHLEKEQLEKLPFALDFKPDEGYALLYDLPITMIALGLASFVGLWIFFWKDQHYGLHEMSLSSGAFPWIFIKKLSLWIVLLLVCFLVFCFVELFTVKEILGLGGLKLQEITGQMETPLALRAYSAFFLLRGTQLLEILFLGMFLLNLSFLFGWERSWVFFFMTLFLFSIPYYLLPIKSNLALLKYFGTVSMLRLAGNWHQNLPFLGRWYGFAPLFVFLKSTLILLMMALGQFLFTKRHRIGLPRLFILRRPPMQFKSIFSGVYKRWLIPGGGLILSVLLLTFWSYDSLSVRRYTQGQSQGIHQYYSRYMGQEASHVLEDLKFEIEELENLRGELGKRSGKMDIKSLEERIALRKEVEKYDGLTDFVEKLQEFAQREAIVINTDGWIKYFGMDEKKQEEMAYTFVQLALTLLIGLGYRKELEREHLGFFSSMAGYERWHRSLRILGYLIVLILVLLGEYGKYLRLEPLYPMRGLGASAMFSVRAPDQLPLGGYLIFHLFVKVLWFGLVFRILVEFMKKIGGLSGVGLGSLFLLLPYLGWEILEPVMSGKYDFYFRLIIMMILLAIHLRWTMKKRVMQ